MNFIEVHVIIICKIACTMSSFSNAGHIRVKPGHNYARLFNPDGEEPAKEVHHLKGLSFKPEGDELNQNYRRRHLVIVY